MSTGKLKAQYNRVRTSTALHTSSIWANTIGIESEGGSNAAIEASIYAPGGAGRGRVAKQQRAQELIEASGYEPSVRDFEGLKALARRSGGDAAALNRGACKMCGGLGHLTKQCRNFLDNGAGGGAAAAGAGGGGADGGGAGGGGDRALLTQEDEALLLGSDSLGGDSSDLGSDSDSDGGRGRKRSKREKSSSGRDKDRGRSSSKKSKKEKSSKKHKKEKSSRKHKREHRSRSRSRERGERSRPRERSRSRSRDRRA